MATIRQKGPYQWHVQIRRKGWPNKTRTLRSKREAEVWARSVEAEMDRGVFNHRDDGLRVSFGELIETYIKEVTAERPSENSRISEKSRLLRFLREEPQLCSYAVSHLQPEHFNEYKKRRLAQPSPNKQNVLISAGTVKRELTLLKRVIDYKKRQFGLPLNPLNTEDVPRPTVNDERDVRLSQQELEKLIEKCGNARNKLLKPIVLFALETGARRGSILRLEWCDVEMEIRKVTFRGVKNSRNPDERIDHSTGLSQKAVNILTALPKSGTCVFPLTGSAVSQAFSRARCRAGLDHFRFHDLRHERVSNLFESGWSMVQVMAISGHKDPKSLKRYANLHIEYLADELDKLDKQ